MFQNIVERHVSLQAWKVKSLQLPKWMTPEIFTGMIQRGDLKHGKEPFHDKRSTRLRNKIT